MSFVVVYMNNVSFLIRVLCISEILVVEELYKEAVLNTERKLIVFNGELDRIRSGCILCHILLLFNMHLSKLFVSKMWFWEINFYNLRNSLVFLAFSDNILSLIWWRLSTILLPKAWCTHEDLSTYDGNCVLHSQLQGPQWRNTF